MLCWANAEDVDCLVGARHPTRRITPTRQVLLPTRFPLEFSSEGNRNLSERFPRTGQFEQPKGRYRE